MNLGVLENMLWSRGVLLVSVSVSKGGTYVCFDYIYKRVCVGMCRCVLSCVNV